MRRLPFGKIVLALALLLVFKGTATQILQTASVLDSVMAEQLATIAFRNR
jgi:hypothetical protein